MNYTTKTNTGFVREGVLHMPLLSSLSNSPSTKRSGWRAMPHCPERHLQSFRQTMAPRTEVQILHLGLPESIERLLCNFLDNKKVRVKMETVLGDSSDLKCGVPQGSVLSPTLFIIYTRDTPTSHTGINISYADDITQIVPYPGKSKEMFRHRTQREI